MTLLRVATALLVVGSSGGPTSFPDSALAADSALGSRLRSPVCCEGCQVPGAEEGRRLGHPTSRGSLTVTMAVAQGLAGPAASIKQSFIKP